METSSSDSSAPPSPVNGRRTARNLPALRFLRSPISSLLEYSGLLRPRPDYPYSAAQTLVPERRTSISAANNRNSGYLESSISNIDGDDGSDSTNNGGAGSSSSNNGEVSIRIIEEDGVGVMNNGENGGNDVGLDVEASTIVTIDGNGNGRAGDSNRGDENDVNDTREGTSSQRYDIQRAARWIEQILPFLLLLLVVFVRQHLQGFFVTIYITAILFKSNDILRKQTALKGERKISILVIYSALFMFHIFLVYWWHRKDALYRPLLMIPPKPIPSFWHAIFIILVNDTMMRQAAMILKFVLLMYYKSGRGHNFRRQGQMLTLVEYTVLLYRALLPTPVWYRFFLNKDYGSLFSALITGLYLTFKLTSIVEKVQSFFSALKALSRKEVQYGSYATKEQVNAAGDLCAICQEKMSAPILLCCKHIFCEDCVSEWFERERTCPLCRALVRPGDLQSYGDGSTSLLFQMF